MDLVLRTNIGIDDIENKIARYVHEGYQKDINKRIQILVNFDWSFNYWCDFQTYSMIPYKEIYIWDDIDDKDTRFISKDEYRKMCELPVFKMNNKIRFNLMFQKCNAKITYERLVLEKKLKSNNYDLKNLNTKELQDQIEIIRKLFYLKYKQTDMHSIYIEYNSKTR